jgi:hypothetical protein
VAREERIRRKDIGMLLRRLLRLPETHRYTTTYTYNTEVVHVVLVKGVQGNVWEHRRTPLDIA